MRVPGTAPGRGSVPFNRLRRKRDKGQEQQMSVSEVDRRRGLNDHRWQQFKRSCEQIAFICECVEPDCFATVALSGAEFEAARATPPQLLLAPGHQSRSDETRGSTKPHQA